MVRLISTLNSVCSCNRFIVRWVVATSVLALLCYSILLGDAQADGRVKIGVAIPATGNAAIWGEDIRNSLMFANEELADGRYELVFEDDGCNPKSSVTAAHKLINIHKVRYVIGMPCSGAVMGAAEIYEKAGVVVISVAASASSVSSAGDFIFRTWPNDANAARLLIEYMASHHKVLGAMTELTEASQSFLSNLKSLLPEAKASLSPDGKSVPRDTVKEILNEDYATDNTDYRSSLMKLKRAGVEGLMLICQSEATFLEILKQARELQFRPQIYSIYLAGGASFREKAKDLAEGIIFADTPSFAEVVGAEGHELLRRFKSKYGELNFGEMLFVSSFEALRGMHEAIQGKQEPREYLYSTKFPGLAGTWSFDKNGDLQGLDFVLKVVRRGAVELLR